MTTALPYGSGFGRGRRGPLLAVAGVALLAVLAVGAIVASGGAPSASSKPSDGASAALGGAAGSPVATDSIASGSDASASSPGSPGASAGGSGGSPVPSLTPGASAGATLLPAASGPFPGGLMIADRGNNRILIVNNKGKVLWRFPVRGSLPKGQGFSADDAFLSPDGKTISANEEQRQVVVRIDIATRRIVWEYGHYGVIGSAPGYLNTPDDSYPLANGDVVIADIFNCRIIEVSPAKKIVRQWGHTRVCVHRPGYDYNQPNGDTPLPDGGLLITEIRGSRVVRLGPDGKVIFDIHVPVAYPSDAQLDPQGNVVVADYSTRGAVVSVSPAGKLLWRYSPASGPGRLDHPSLAVPRADGTVVLNDDFRHRVLLIDPKTGTILWQYGVTDQHGTGANHLFIPDGLDQLPAGLFPGA
jgi:outer membrane protein assembly factor BamB